MRQPFSVDFVQRYPAPFVAVVLAAVFSATVMLPSFLQRADATYPYQGIHILGPDAEDYYAARVREVYDGFPGLGSVFFSAPKDAPYIQPPVPEVTIATVGRLAGADAITAFLGSKAILSFAVFLLLFAFLVVVTDAPWISLIATSALLFGGALLSAPWDLPHFLNPARYDFEFLRFSRAINPQWSASWFFIALIGIAAWMKSHHRKFLLLATVATVVLVYSYVYAWTYIFVTMGLLALWYLIHGDWRRVSGLAVYWSAVIVCTTPYAIHVYALSHHPLYAETAARFGMVLRHGPLVLGIWLGIFIGMGFASRRLWPRTWPLLPLLSLAGLIAINQHIVTGNYIVPHHYHWYFIQPLSSAFAVAVLLTLFLPVVRPRFHTLIGVVIVLSAVSVALVQQWRSYQAVAPLWGTVQNAAPVISYIGKTMRPGQVVFTLDVTLANQLPVHTSADVYYSLQSTNSLVSTERARFLYFFELWLQGLPPEQVLKEFGGEKKFMLSSRLHSIYYREAKGNFEALPDAEVRKNAALYREFYALPLREKVTRYPLSAVITTPTDPINTVWSEFLACSKETFAANGYALRTMIPAGYTGSCL